MTMSHSAIVALHQIKFNVPTVGDVYVVLEAPDPKEIDPDDLINAIEHVSLASAVRVIKDTVGCNRDKPVVSVPFTVGDQQLSLSFAMPEGDFSRWEDEDKRLYYVELLDDYKDDIVLSIKNQLVGLQ